MAMLGVQDLRNGMTFLMDGALYMTLKYEHIKMGRGSATIKIKAKNMISGATTDKSFVNSAKVEEANTSRRPMQFLYKDGQSFVFMDPKSFEQVEISKTVAAENGVYLKEKYFGQYFILGRSGTLDRASSQDGIYCRRNRPWDQGKLCCQYVQISSLGQRYDCSGAFIYK